MRSTAAVLRSLPRLCTVFPVTASAWLLRLTLLGRAVPAPLVAPAEARVVRSPDGQRTPRGAMPEVDPGDPGEAVSCVDVCTEPPFEFQARRLLASDAENTGWAPDSSRGCVGSAQSPQQVDCQMRPQSRALTNRASGEKVVRIERRVAPQ